MLNHLQAQQRAEEIEAQIEELQAQASAGGHEASVMSDLEALIGEVTVKWDREKGEAHFYGLVTSKQTGPSFRKMLASMADRKEIKLYINSIGGDPMTGIAIYNMLARAEQRIITISEGQAYSSASVIFMAGDERLVAQSAIVGIHRPRRVLALGNADDLLSGAAQLEELDRSFMSIYSARCKDEAAVEKVKAKMWADTMVGQKECQELGLATGVAPVKAKPKKEPPSTTPVTHAAAPNESPEVADEAVVKEAQEHAAASGTCLAALGINWRDYVSEEKGGQSGPPVV